MESLEREMPMTAPKLTINTAEALKANKRMKWKDNVVGYFFLAPSLVLFAIFLFYPLLQSVYLSVHLTDPRGRIASFVGAENFMNLLASDTFWNTLKVTGLFTLLTIPAGIALGLVMAALTHTKLRLMRF